MCLLSRDSSDERAVTLCDGSIVGDVSLANVGSTRLDGSFQLIII